MSNAPGLTSGCCQTEAGESGRAYEATACVPAGGRAMRARLRALSRRHPSPSLLRKAHPEGGDGKHHSGANYDDTARRVAWRHGRRATPWRPGSCLALGRRMWTALGRSRPTSLDRGECHISARLRLSSDFGPKLARSGPVPAKLRDRAKLSAMPLPKLCGDFDRPRPPLFRPDVRTVSPLLKRFGQNFLRFRPSSGPTSARQARRTCFKWHSGSGPQR